MSSNPRDQDLCLNDFVRGVVRQYLEDMGETAPENLHSLIMKEVECPLIETVLNHTEGNQSQAAQILGITRTTLRNRLKRYGLD